MAHKTFKDPARDINKALGQDHWQENRNVISPGASQLVIKFTHKICSTDVNKIHCLTALGCPSVEKSLHFCAIITLQLHFVCQLTDERT